MMVKKSCSGAVGPLTLLLVALVVALALPALAEDGKQAAQGKQIMMVFTTDNNGELNACG